MNPFRIEIPQSELDYLQRRLADVRWPAQVEGVGWDRGAPLDHLKELVAYWAGGYDWRTWEKRLNSHPQFTTEIDGQNIHFIHVRSENPEALPLLLAHGWPGSVVEFLDVIEPLSADFHLVIPSHPNFGFSGPAGAGWDSFRIAKAYAELMNRLGYERFGAQGGDYGAFIAPDLARVAPDRVVGVHVNAATMGFIPFQGPGDAVLTESEQVRLARMNDYMNNGNGYFQIQATKPHTLGFALADSPVGQLAWVAEKFHDWAEPVGSIDKEHVITHAMIYWLTNTGSSSAQMYYESMHSSNWPYNSGVPTAVANFAQDIAIRQFSEEANTIVRWNEFDEGGHFAALEAPELFVRDVREFFTSL
ncbi:epoxide hydrolase family protein [Nonomuraea soli]|uniref:Pimeloyl-ACP methyl ester carboxylesterase n=1 Tax=Nonomuraea soli TaxID=1032476 RepID=A0A7W0CJY9_9ACTN|nr:epoxide hydrolase family protein [Nonomuraea soli]MBA2892561.1 pimeloyl-ACP methyl ester carboxylesterase [Nonomuraea soli]